MGDLTVGYIVTAAIILNLCIVTSSCPPKCKCSRQETICLNASLSVIPRTLNKNTVKLTMSYNNIQTLIHDNTTNLQQLRIVFLCMNGIHTLGPRIFCASRELLILNLSKNEIDSINSESFICLQKLSYLYLNDNNISYINSNLFKSNNKLFLLDLRNNALKTIVSDAFQNNSLLSLVLVENNYMGFYWSSLNFLNASLNTVDIEFCTLNETSPISYQSLPRLQELKSNTSELFAVTELSNNTELLNVITSKLEEVNYGPDDYVYFNATLNQITLPSNIALLCYCDRMSAWFWCSEHCPTPVGLTHMYKTLKCNKEYEQEVQNQTSGLDSHLNKETDRIGVYVSVAAVLACLVVISSVVVVFILRHKRKKATEETGSSLAQNSFIFQNLRAKGYLHVYEEIPAVALSSSAVSAYSV